MGKKRSLGCFFIEAILNSSSKRQRVEEEVKEERPESPTSTTSDLLLPLLTTTASPTKLSPSPSPLPPASLSPSPKFPLWTQCQRNARRSHRPYSRHKVALLSWWFHHLPFLAMEEMETVAWLAGLTRQQNAEADKTLKVKYLCLHGSQLVELGLQWALFTLRIDSGPIQECNVLKFFIYQPRHSWGVPGGLASLTNLPKMSSGATQGVVRCPVVMRDQTQPTQNCHQTHH